jgi:integrase
MPKLKLTKTTVEALPLTQKGQVVYFDTLLPGFGVYVGMTGRSYFAQRQIGRKTCRVTIGAHGVFTTEQARAEARNLLLRMAKGENPNQAKRAALTRDLTLTQMSELYLEARRNLRPFTQETYRRIFNSHLKAWAAMPLAEITPTMVLSHHARLGGTVGKPTANGVMRVLRAIYNFGMVMDDRLLRNPVLHLTRTRAWYREKRLQTVIALHQLPAWLKAVQGLDNPDARDFLLLTLFTGMRRSEGMALRWSNVDLISRTLTVPITKNHEPLMLPLPSILWELLTRRKSARRNSDWVFPGMGKSGHLEEPKKAIAKVREASGVSFTLHDLRRTFITVAEGLDISSYTLKRLLNHKDKRDVTAGYIVLNVERLRAPMQRIADHILSNGRTSSVAHERATEMASVPEEMRTASPPTQIPAVKN